MSTRFQQLRQSVSNLAAPADEQARYLDRLFTSLTCGGSASGYGNDELALELEDIFRAADDMVDHGELTEMEKEAVQPLDEMLAEWSSQDNADFWRRDALFVDPRWAEVRSCASRALAQLPDEVRSVGRSV
ncbi:MAG: hypothetical protein SFV20_00840 [Sphingopyxis sp.]|nr:hypothetical protein [Sphingopyxis sp.]